MSAILIILAELAFGLWATRDFSQRERRFALGALALHIVSSFGTVKVVEGGDALGYLQTGSELALLLDFDFPRFAPEIFRLALHLDANLPFETFGAGSSTGTMGALAGFFVYGLGPSLLSACLMTTVVGWFGQLCLYRVARDEFAKEEQTAALIGCLFVPSAVFWGSAFAKEAFVVGPFGVLALSTYRLFRKRHLLSLVGVVGGGVGVALLKPYILFPYIIGVATWIYAERVRSKSGTIRVHPGYLALAALVAAGGIAGVSSLFPEYGVSRIAETVADQQGGWLKISDTGSVLDVGSEDARSLSQQLPYVPLALANALFRPLLFEARNGPMLGAALETTATTLGLVTLILRFSWRRTLAAILGSPPLMFSLSFVLLFAIAVGLATSNLGSLSRYRMPMMPFYATALLVLAARSRKPTPQ